MLKRFFSSKKKDDPSQRLDDAIKDAEAQYKKAEVQYRKTIIEIFRYEDVLMEHKMKKSDLLLEAKEHKMSNNQSLAINSLKMAVRIEDWIKYMTPNVDELKERAESINRFAKNLANEVDSYRLEYDLLQSSSDIANNRLASFEEDDVNTAHIDKMLKMSHDKIHMMHYEIEAKEKIHEIAGKDSERKANDSVIDSRAKDLYNNL